MNSRLAEIRELCKKGQYLAAYEASKPLGPLQDWTGVENLILAGRLAARLGSLRLGVALHRRAWRENRQHIDARYYYCFGRMIQFGPLAGWKWMRRLGDPVGATPKQWGDWYGLRADIMAMWRDFDRAEHWIGRALEMAPNDPFVHVQRSTVFLAEDRLDEALRSVERAMELAPWYRPAVEAQGHILVHMNRDAEAIRFLREACERIDAGSVRWQLALLYRELGRDEEARRVAETLTTHYPLMDKGLRRAISGLLASAAYRCDDYEAALRYARRVDDPKNKFFANMRTRLENPSEKSCRVILDVEFVRQHHDTCAPATLAALSGYWGRPVDHSALAEEICYGGTPAWRGRLWAERQGFLVREFRVTWETAVALIEREVPFALEVAGADWSHIQALVGYDGWLRTFLVRDSNHRVHGEAIADGLLSDQRAYGPRGMLLVPPEEAGRLDGVELLETDYHDEQYAMHLALDRHDREEAARIMVAAEARDPAHRMTLMMRWLLASYDHDITARLHCVERLAEAYPENARLAMARLNLLVDQGRRETRLEILREKSRAEETEYVFWQQYAAELLCDAREHREAEYYLRRAIRANPSSGVSYGMLSTILWDRQDRETAYELNRVAACLELTREQLAKNYFMAAVHLRREDEALEFLRNRFNRFLSHSGAPATTLCWAHANLARTGEALAALEEAIERRPEDGDLLLFAAQQFGSFGDFDRADRVLADARPHCRGVDWLRAAARVAQIRGEPQRALAQWREVAQIEPLAIDAHESVARLLSDQESADAAIQYLEGVVQSFPHHCEIRALYIQWIGDEDPQLRERALRDLLELNPADPEARERLALVLRSRNRLDEAMQEAQRAFELDPRRPTCWVTRAMIHEFRGEIDRAKELCREAIRLSVDFEWAIDYLIGLSDTHEERREALALIRHELTRQVTQGDGVLSYRQYAAQTLEDEELLGVLREAHAERPDLWHAWSALIRQLSDMDRDREALALAREAVERFPLLPRLWLDLAVVCRQAEDSQGELEALERALRVSPNWPEATRELAEAHQRAGNHAQARAVLERAIVTQPGHCVNHAYLADALWEAGEKDAAIEQVRLAVGLDPGYRWAWDALRRWGRELKRPQLVIEAARDLVQRRPYQPRSWFILADQLHEPEHRAEAKEALEMAIRLNPVFVDAYQLLAHYMTEEGDYDAALETCRPAVFGDQPPWDLRIRAAQVEAHRGNLRSAAEQMKAAVADNPNSLAAWQKLADLYCDMHEAEAYYDACQAMCRIAPESPVPHGYLGEACEMRGRPDEAAQAYEMALTRDPQYFFAAESLYKLHFAAAEAEAIDRLIAQIETSAPVEAVLAWRIGAAVLRQDRMAATELLGRLARVDAEHPRWLGGAGEAMCDAAWQDDVTKVYDRAIAEIRQEQGEPPLSLCVVASHHHASLEDLALAVEWMRRAVDVSPDYHVGWRWLSIWADQTRQLDAYLAATQHASRLDPADGVSVACIGDARLQRGETDEALKAFSRAVELSPNKEYCATQLFDLQLGRGDLAGARAAIDRIVGHMPDAYVLRQEIRLAAAREGLAAALRPLETLCLAEGEIENDLLHAVDGLLMILGPHRLRAVLRELGRVKDPNPGVATVYVHAACRQSMGAARRFLRRQRVGEESWFRGLAEYLVQAARRGTDGQLPPDWRRLVPTHPRTWGAKVVSSVERGYYHDADRTPVESDDRAEDVVGLMYRTLGLRACGRLAQAAEVEERWRVMSDDYRVANHAAWIACRFTERGDWGPAARWLREAQPEHMSHFHKVLYRLAHFMLQVSRWMPEDLRPKTFAEARRSMCAEIDPLAPMLLASPAIFRRLYHGCLRLLARRYGRPLQALWHGFRAG